MKWFWNKKKIIELSDDPKVQKKIQKFWDYHGDRLMNGAIKGLAIKLAYQKGLEDGK